jgi:hypothetical protein
VVPRVYSDGEEAPLKRPKRVVVPSAKVISADNAADQELSSHQRAHNASRAINPPTSPGSTRITDDEIDSELISSSKQTKRLIKGMVFISADIISLHYNLLQAKRGCTALNVSTRSRPRGPHSKEAGSSSCELLTYDSPLNPLLKTLKSCSKYMSHYY